MSTTTLLSCPDTFYESFHRKGAQPWTTHYCAGCGHGLIHKYTAEAVADFGVQDQAIFISSVGCSVFAYYYLDMGNVQVPHGRCPAVATALKRANPEALVLGHQGDGDLAAIGGNEILHAANRGENITLFFLNNAIYGMTGGQMAPTTLLGMTTTTTPEGRQQQEVGLPVRVCELLATLDAPYYLERVALGDARHNRKARAAVRKAIRNQLDNRGFSLVEILSPCPTGWKKDPVAAAQWNLEEMTRTFPLGVFRDGHDLDLGHPRLRSAVSADSVPELLDIPQGDERIGAGDASSREEVRVKVAGFGGQGVIALGTVLAQAGMLADREVSWIPSYGPEMRGGTANCSVTISHTEIGSPLIDQPTHLVAMNGPSLDKFLDDVVPGGVVLYNASMVQEPPSHADRQLIGVPVNAIAERIGHPEAGNMVMLGALAGIGCAIPMEAIVAAMTQKLGKTHLETNQEALTAGLNAVRLRGRRARQPS